jgi:hypothetical protein
MDEELIGFEKIDLDRKHDRGGQGAGYAIDEEDMNMRAVLRAGSVSNRAPASLKEIIAAGEAATSEVNTKIDFLKFEKVMDLCSSINNKKAKELKEFVIYLRKRLKSKSLKIVMLVLELLDYAVINGNDALLFAMSNTKLLKRLKELINRATKNGSLDHLAIKKKCLYLIKLWGERFGEIFDEEEYGPGKEMVVYYRNLLSRGQRFPEEDFGVLNASHNSSLDYNDNIVADTFSGRKESHEGIGDAHKEMGKGINENLEVKSEVDTYLQEREAEEKSILKKQSSTLDDDDDSEDYVDYDDEDYDDDGKLRMEPIELMNDDINKGKVDKYEEAVQELDRKENEARMSSLSKDSIPTKPRPQLIKQGSTKILFGDPKIWKNTSKMLHDLLCEFKSVESFEKDELVHELFFAVTNAANECIGIINALTDEGKVKDANGNEISTLIALNEIIQKVIKIYNYVKVNGRVPDAVKIAHLKRTNKTKSESVNNSDGFYTTNANAARKVQESSSLSTGWTVQPSPLATTTRQNTFNFEQASTQLPATTPVASTATQFDFATNGATTKPRAIHTSDLNANAFNLSVNTTFSTDQVSSNASTPMHVAPRQTLERSRSERSRPTRRPPPTPINQAQSMHFTFPQSPNTNALSGQSLNNLSQPSINVSNNSLNVSTSNQMMQTKPKFGLTIDTTNYEASNSDNAVAINEVKFVSLTLDEKRQFLKREPSAKSKPKRAAPNPTQVGTKRELDQNIKREAPTKPPLQKEDEDLDLL